MVRDYRLDEGTAVIISSTTTDADASRFYR